MNNQYIIGQSLTYNQILDLPHGSIFSVGYIMRNSTQTFGETELIFETPITDNQTEYKDPNEHKTIYKLAQKCWWDDGVFHSAKLISIPEHPIMGKIIHCDFCGADTPNTEYHDCKNGTLKPVRWIDTMKPIRETLDNPKSKRYDIIYLDMDGVIVNFEKAVLTYFNKPLDTFIDQWDMEKVLNITEKEMKDAMSSSPLFWSTMEKFPWADGLFDWCTKNADKVMFLSKPSSTPASYSGKAEWLMNHYPKVDFCLTTTKSPNSRPGVLLIDDYLPNIVKFRMFGGHAALFPRPWNCGMIDAGQDKIRMIELDIEKYHGKPKNKIEPKFFFSRKDIINDDLNTIGNTVNKILSTQNEKIEMEFKKWLAPILDLTPKDDFQIFIDRIVKRKLKINSYEKTNYKRFNTKTIHYCIEGESIKLAIDIEDPPGTHMYARTYKN